MLRQIPLSRTSEQTLGFSSLPPFPLFFLLPSGKNFVNRMLTEVYGFNFSKHALFFDIKFSTDIRE